jgi:hypothetical protein
VGSRLSAQGLGIPKATEASRFAYPKVRQTASSSIATRPTIPSNARTISGKNAGSRHSSQTATARIRKRRSMNIGTKPEPSSIERNDVILRTVPKAFASSRKADGGKGKGFATGRATSQSLRAPRAVYGTGPGAISRENLLLSAWLKLELPPRDYLFSDLDPAWQDDQLIADVLAYIAVNPGEAVRS